MKLNIGKKKSFRWNVKRGDLIYYGNAEEGIFRAIVRNTPVNSRGSIMVWWYSNKTAPDIEWVDKQSPSGCYTISSLCKQWQMFLRQDNDAPIIQVVDRRKTS